MRVGTTLSKQREREWEELDKKLHETASKTINNILKKMNLEEVNLNTVNRVINRLRGEVFSKYIKHSYYNFGNPIPVSLITSPTGVLVKILPVKSKKSFEEIYGIPIELMRELIKKGLVIPVLDEKVEYFVESDDEIIDLVYESVERDMILNYYYEELFKITKVKNTSTSVHNEAWKLVNVLSEEIHKETETSEWYKKLGVKKRLAYEEMKYNTFLTIAQYMTISPEKANLVIKLIQENQTSKALRFLFYNSTFETDPVFYSPSGHVTADMADIKYGIIELINMKMKIPPEFIKKVGTYVYEGLLTEVGSAIIRNENERQLKVVKHSDKLSELIDMIDKSQKLKDIRMEIETYIYEALEKQEQLNLEELNSLIDRYVDEAVQVYHSISDNTQVIPPGKRTYITIGTIGVTTMAIYLLVAGFYDPSRIYQVIPGFIGFLSNILGIFEMPLKVKRIWKEYIEKLSKLEHNKKRKLFERQLGVRLNILPMVSVIDVSKN